MGRFLLGYCLLLWHGAAGQQHQGDWDAYLMQTSNKPVSIIVDLALGKKAPMKERPFVIIVRSQLQYPDNYGMPGKAELTTLDEMEEGLVEKLARNNGAMYAGRFTQRSIREFYFYALDTVNYHLAVQQAMSAFKEYKWLTQAKDDKTWTNYFTVLYPPPVDMEKIQNRRLIDRLKNEGDSLTRSRQIDHYFYFKTKIKRDEFIRNTGISAFTIAELSDNAQSGEFPYPLHIYKNDVPDYSYIERVLIPFWEAARKYQGKYDGWETYLVK